MKRITLEWVEKAEEDYRAADWLAQAPMASPAAIGFHSQQCAEKYLKATLQERAVAFPKTHDLATLVDLLPDDVKKDCQHIATWKYLSPFAMNLRYPGLSVSDDDAREALQACTAIRDVFRGVLGMR